MVAAPGSLTAKKSSAPEKSGIKNNRRHRSHRFCRDRCGNAGRDQHRDGNANQLRSKRRQAIVAAIRPTIFDCEVAALDKVGLVEARSERGQERRVFVSR